MSWGAFLITEDGWIHIAPHDDHDRPAHGHVLNQAACWCKPELDEYGLVFHNQPDWPGGEEIAAAIGARRKDVGYER